MFPTNTGYVPNFTERDSPYYLTKDKRDLRNKCVCVVVFLIPTKGQLRGRRALRGNWRYISLPTQGRQYNRFPAINSKWSCRKPVIMDARIHTLIHLKPAHIFVGNCHIQDRNWYCYFSFRNWRYCRVLIQVKYKIQLLVHSLHYPVSRNNMIISMHQISVSNSCWIVSICMRPSSNRKNQESVNCINLSRRNPFVSQPP